MLKRNLLLGLMVFMVGVLITACGDKNTTAANTTTEDKIGDTFDDNACEDCTRTYRGTFRILDEDLYLQAFEHRTGTDIDFNFTGGDTIFDRIFNEIASDTVQVGTGVAVCSGKIFFTELIADLANVDNLTTECDYTEVDIFDDFDNNNGSDELRSSYTATLQVRYVNSEADAVKLVVANVLNGDDEEIFRFDRNNVFINNNNTLLLTNSSGRIRVGTTGGRVFGEFRD